MQWLNDIFALLMVPLTTFPKTTLIVSNDLEKFSCTAGKIDNLPFEYFLA
jgi:hypothetical protein